jgi:formylglycine-generating enzyme required for sulfatase activity
MPIEQEQAKFVSGDVTLTVTEAIDLLWLMVQIGQPVGVAEVVEPEETVVDPIKNVKPVVDRHNELASKTAPIHTISRRSQETEPESGVGLPISIADTSALRDALALERSLRPLMRKQPSFTEMILDEEATAISIAEAEQTDKRFWVPVLKPVPTRWLEVAFVIEETERYHLWQPILTEFQQLLERHGAFRNVSLWHMKAGANGQVQIYSKKRQASFKELLDPSGKRLIWLASDCVSPIWHNGTLMKVLRDWARVQPVSLLQLLPEQLWSRTALGWGVEVKLQTEIPGLPNSQLLKHIPTYEPQLKSWKALTLPIVTLEALPLKNWAKVLAGVGGSKTTGLVFLPEEVTPQESSSDRTKNELSAKARVSRFRAAASSPLSRELACMMAAAPVSLPVIRLIQQTLLPRSNSVHVTEVLMGGLLKSTKPKMRNGVTEEIGYEFYEGVREELVKITSISKTVDVIQCISEFVDRELRLRQSVRNFDAILFNPDVEIDADYLPFAQITAKTLQLLGGRFAELAQQIYQKIQYPNPTTENPETSGDELKPEFLEFEPFDVVSIQILNLEMESIPEGSFMMGSPKTEEDGYEDERPQHKVKVPAFMIGKYPITQAQWRVVATLPKVKINLKPDPSSFKGEDRPVEQISWLEAVEFCRRLSNHTRREYRLPSEAEWEYACRAGTTTAYSFGDKANELGEYAWYSENSESQTHPVGQKQPNAFGLYDMHGNVWEWCADDWHESYKGAPKDSQIWIKDIKYYEDPETSKLLRGGSWYSDAWGCRSACRIGGHARLQNLNLGFRVVCVVR